MFKECLKMSWQNIIHNKMRTFLTTLGIMIGVSAIIALITIVQGISNTIESGFSDLGANSLTINATGTDLQSGLTENDIQNISKIDNVSGISPSVSLKMPVVKNNDIQKNVDIQGKNEVYFKAKKDIVKRGRAINSLDVENKNTVCLINQDIQDSLFYGEDPINQNLIIGGVSYNIIGVLNNEDNSIMSSMGTSSSEYSVILPYKNVMLMSDQKNIISAEVYVLDSEKMDQTKVDIERTLDQIFNYKEDSYSIINMKSLVEQISESLSLLRGMLVGVASISLLVGGIGIMNMMLVSVTERTTEIGLRKALGAEPSRIQLQFLVESIILSLIGGLIGILLGILISWGVLKISDVDFVISSQAIMLGVGFSAVVGIIFGWAPSSKASRLNPIDALRSN